MLRRATRLLVAPGLPRPYGRSLASARGFVPGGHRLRPLPLVATALSVSAGARPLRRGGPRCSVGDRGATTFPPRLPDGRPPLYNLPPGRRRPASVAGQFLRRGHLPDLAH